MIKYVITSVAFKGEAELTYDENGERPAINFYNTDIRQDQQAWLLRWFSEFGISESALLKNLEIKRSLNFTCKRVDFEPTFADFWATYFKKRYKDNSSKKTSEKRWNAMSKSAQAAAYNYIPQYFLQIPAGTQPKLAETYLSSEVWVR